MTAMPRNLRKSPRLADFRRIVVKVGSSLLVDSAGGRVHEDWLVSLAGDISGLHAGGRDILVVSSGAIALGRSVLKLPKGPLKLEDSQAAAAVGQIDLAHAYEDAFRARHGGDTRGEPVVVAVADLVGGDRVVLVDHRYCAPFQ